VCIDRKAAEALYQSGIEPTVTVLVELSAENEKYKLQIAKLSKNSTNSSKPPSTDIVRKPKSLRIKSGRPSGGQPGHKGHGLKQTATPERIIPLHCTGACVCGRDLNNAKVENYEKRQIIDLPEPKPETTEYVVNCIRRYFPRA
jgi:transposase